MLKDCSSFMYVCVKNIRESGNVEKEKNNLIYFFIFIFWLLWVFVAVHVGFL